MKIRNIKLNLIIFVGLLILSFAVFAYAQNNSSSNKNIFLDSDQDGLSDEEEKTYGTDPNKADTDGDGYTDGAEIKSGYNPLKPAPGDKIVNQVTNALQATSNKQQTANIKQGSSSKTQETESKQDSIDKEQGTSTDQKIATDEVAINTENEGEEKNLTQEFSAKVAALLTDSSQEQQNITMQDLDSMIQEMTSQSLTYEDLPTISDDEIIIRKQKYDSLSDEARLAKEKEDALEYLTAVCYIMANNSPQKVTDPKDLEDLSANITDNISKLSTNFSDISYFENLAEKGTVSLEQMKEVEVPENMVEIHKRGLQLLTYAVMLKDTAKFKTNDPIYNILNFSKVQSLMSLGNEFSSDVRTQLNELGITEIPLNL